MRAYRCLCGDLQLWTTDGVPACQACKSCKKTVASGPDGHRDPEPHVWTKVSHGRGDDGKPLTSTACAVCHISKFDYEQEKK